MADVTIDNGSDLAGQLELFEASAEADASAAEQALARPASHTSNLPPQIKRVWVQNFKGYERFDVRLGRFNVLVGANNAGKSTLLQAIDLIYALLKIHSESGRLASSGRLLPPGILPVATLRDLFHNGVWRTGNEYVPAVVGAEFIDGSRVEFGIRLLFGNGNSRVREQVGMTDSRLATLLSHPAVWVPSAVGIVREEEYRTAARRTGLISGGRHNEVLRNLLYGLKQESPDRFDRLQSILQARFNGQLAGVTFDEALDQFVSTDFASSKGAQHDLFSAGAGFVQVVQLLAFVLNGSASIVLLDEPDAHLHSSLQRVVIEILDELAASESFQVVLATHSKEIINFVDPTRLILIEDSSSTAEPVGDAVTPMTILRSMGDIDNVDAYSFVKNRRCLFVEGQSDLTILGRFAATLKNRSFTGDDRVVAVAAGGVDKFDHVRQLEVLERILGASIHTLQVRDRDAMIDDDRQQIIDAAPRPMHVLLLDSIESYLIHPRVIGRVIDEIASERGMDVRASEDEVRELAMEATESLRDDTIDRIATKYIEIARSNNMMVVANQANPKAREALAAAWDTLEERLTLVSGKRLLALIRSRVQNAYGVNFGNERLAESFDEDEIPEEIKGVLSRVAELSSMDRA
jgi:ABC-type cobalamin/Fe3+-siderophores transport system ATPase subunit